MEEIKATSGELVIFDSWLEGYLNGNFTIYGTLNKTTLTITRVDLKVAHGGTNYQTTNSYIYYLIINGWEISTTVKATTPSNGKVNYNGTIWTGTKTFELTPGASSLSCDSRIYISNGRTYYNTGVKSINLGVTVKLDMFYLKTNNQWLAFNDMLYKFNNKWSYIRNLYKKENGVWKTLFDELYIIKDGEIKTPLSYTYLAGDNHVVSWSYNSVDKSQDFTQPVWSDCNVYPTTPIDLKKYTYLYIDCYCAGGYEHNTFIYRDGTSVSSYTKEQYLMTGGGSINPRKTFKIPIDTNSWNIMLGFANLGSSVVKIYNMWLSKF